MFWGLVWFPLRSCLREAPGPQKSSRNRKGNKICVASFFHELLHLLQHTFCTCGLAGRVHGESHCNYSRLELYLLTLGKVKMLTQYPQIALGVRR